MLLFLSLFTNVAGAAVIDVPAGPNGLTLPQAVDQANDGDIIRVEPGVHEVSRTMVIRGKSITIEGNGNRALGGNPPYEIADPDIDDDVMLSFDFDNLLLLDPDLINGMFVLENGGELTVSKVFIKAPEVFCGDAEDNDGNGLVDNLDPFCSTFVFPADTAAGGGIDDSGALTADLSAWQDSHAFTLESDTSLTLDQVIVQGWALPDKGAVIYSEDAAAITISNSIIGHNWTVPTFWPRNHWWRNGYGAIYVSGPTDFQITSSHFLNNVSRRGGAIFAIQSVRLNVEDSIFAGNEGEDGGAFWLESVSSADFRRNTFANNGAIRVPFDDIWAPHEGGSIYGEYSNVSIKNNVFYASESLDFGADVFLRNRLTVSPEVVNNSFVDPRASFFGGGGSVVFDNTDFTFRNNILDATSAGGVGALNWPLPGAPDIAYNDFQNSNTYSPLVLDLALFPLDFSTNVSVDPEFVYYNNLDQEYPVYRFQLRATSPVIDAGDPTIMDAVDARHGPSRSDMGAYGGPDAAVVDADDDGWVDIYDCDDDDPSVFPFNFEACDDADNDCNGVVDDREGTWYIDRDYDGYGEDDPANLADLGIGPGDEYPLQACPEIELPELAVGIYVSRGGDCNDNNARENPGNPEFCDGEDNDCDGFVDEEIAVREQWPDDDGDGFGSVDFQRVVNQACPPPGFSPFSNDCDDADPDVHPLIDVAATLHEPLADSEIEFNEADRDIRFVADGIDQDCDSVDLCFADLDGDGHGAAPDANGNSVYQIDNDTQCNNLSALTASDQTDCDDRDATAFPGGDEIIGDGRDQNCDGRDLCYEDRDGDGYGDDNTRFTDNNLDCDDGSTPTSSRGGDCVDDPDVGGENANPEKPEECDGLDNNCDGLVDEVTSPDAKEYFLDADGDGFGVATEVIRACAGANGQPPIGYSERAGDCNDDEARAFPDAQEICDGIDNNCRSGIDEDDAIDVKVWYIDRDGDGFGSRELEEESCDPPSADENWVEAGKAFDCDDSDAAILACVTCTGCAAPGGSNSSTLPLLGLVFSVLTLRRRRTDRT